MNDPKKMAKKIYILSLSLLLVLVPIIILFIFNDDFSIDAQIDDGKFGTFGDFVGGVLGSIWSLCGVLLFYNALKEQREDFGVNKKALEQQIESLNLQTTEFRLQRNELMESRNVFKEQAKILMQQRLEVTYFSLMRIYNDILSDLDAQSEKNKYFKQLKLILNKIDLDSLKGNPLKCHSNSNSEYLQVFYEHKEDLAHYFKIIYRIIKIIDDASIAESEKFRYVKIFRSQLSENEMLAVYYNSHSHYGGGLYKFILKYNLLKHLPCMSKVEFKYVLSKMFIDNDISNLSPTEQKNKMIALLFRFNNEIIMRLREFEINMSSSMLSDDFNSHRESYQVVAVDYLVFEVESREENELNIKFTSTNGNDAILNFQLDVFIDYFKLFLFDLFVFSNYLDLKKVDNFICASKNNNEIIFNLELYTKLKITKDIE